ncbi:limonene hydroxylase [Brevibacillus fluminis]|uniref:limonene hydroxylase n=1 Tax=Brevibacillus fluminis TaxID=511487 RepID=UPI003F8B88A1
MLRFFRKEALYPWMRKPSIYEYIQNNMDETGHLRDNTLPDDEEFWEGKGIRWVAGGLDGTFSHHVAGGNGEANVRELVQLIAKQSRKPGNKARRETYVKLMQVDILSVIDPLLEALLKEPGVHLENLYNEAYWMAENGADRNVVKLGMAILGQFQTEHHKQLVMTLGKHDEFTLYAAVAIQNSLNDANSLLFELARFAKRWGKIHLVERIEPATSEIKDWLIRNGFRNDVMDEYLACICARNGELHLALESERIDSALYEGAGGIISALLAGGPAEDIDDYEHAATVVKQYLRHAERMCSTLSQLVVLFDLVDFLNQDEERWESRYQTGWKAEDRESLQKICRSIIEREEWSDQIQSGLQSGVPGERYAAIRAGKALGWDIWPILFEQLQKDPLNYTLFFEVMNTDERERAQAVVSFAEQALPLSRVATGPADELGIGPGFEPHRLLSVLLQSLDRFEGLGVSLIKTGLKSPVVNNRNMALRALEGWTARWTDTLRENLLEAAAKEPDNGVKERIEKLLQQNNEGNSL